MVVIVAGGGGGDCAGIGFGVCIQYLSAFNRFRGLPVYLYTRIHVVVVVVVVTVVVVGG